MRVPRIASPNLGHPLNGHSGKTSLIVDARLTCEHRFVTRPLEG